MVKVTDWPTSHLLNPTPELLCPCATPCVGPAGDGCASLTPQQLQSLNKELGEVAPVTEALAHLTATQQEVCMLLFAPNSISGMPFSL